MKKRSLWFTLFFFLFLGVAFFFLRSKLPKVDQLPSSQTSSDQQNFPKTPLSPSFEIKNFDYIGGEKDCCVCSGLTSLYKFNGGSVKIFDTLAPMALNHDLTYITKSLKEFTLQGKLRLGYYYRGVTKENRSSILKDFSANLEEPQKQITLFKNGDEAFETLKMLLSANTPVMFAWEDSERLGNPQEECQDDTYNVAIGYDQQKITFHTLPGIKSSVSISEFRKKWQLQNSEFCYWIFPGSYSLIWLEKD